MSYLCLSLDPWHLCAWCTADLQCMSAEWNAPKINWPPCTSIPFSGKIIEHLVDVKSDKHKTLSLTEVPNKWQLLYQWTCPYRPQQASRLNGQNRYNTSFEFPLVLGYWDIAQLNYYFYLDSGKKILHLWAHMLLS